MPERVVGDPAARDAAPRKRREKGTENVSRDTSWPDAARRRRDRDRRKVDRGLMPEHAVDAPRRSRRRRAVRRGASRSVRHGRRRRAGRARPPRRPGAVSGGERSRRPRGLERGAFARRKRPRGGEARARRRRRRGRRRTPGRACGDRARRVVDLARSTTRSRSGWRRRTRRSSPRWCTRRGRCCLAAAFGAQVAPRVPGRRRAEAAALR